MVIRIIGIRRYLSSTVSRSRIPELLPRSEYTRKTALTAPDRATGQNEYTQEEYQNFLRLVLLLRSRSFIGASNRIQFSVITIIQKCTCLIQEKIYQI